MPTVIGSEYPPKTHLAGRHQTLEVTTSSLMLSNRQKARLGTPIFNYTEFLDDVFDKECEAVLEYTNGDRARATVEFLFRFGNRSHKY